MKQNSRRLHRLYGCAEMLLHWKLLTFIVLLGLSGTLHSQELQFSRNLFEAGQQASLENKIMVLYVARQDCPYCAALEREVLLPNLTAGEAGGFILVKLLWNEEAIVDFNGHWVSADALMDRFGVQVTPTMLFVGADGEELAGKQIGYQSRDYYWHYFMGRIRSARERQKISPSPVTPIEGTGL